MPNKKDRILRRIYRKLLKFPDYPTPIDKAQDLTGLHSETLNKLQCQGRIKLNSEEVTRSVIYEALCRFSRFKRGSINVSAIPTANELFERLVKHGFDHMNIGDFKRLLVKFDFIWKQVGVNKILIIENPVVRFERFEYLTKIKQSRIARYDAVIFVDEMAYNQDFFMNIEESNDLARETDIWQQRVIYAVGVKTVTCMKEIDEFNASTFENWLTTELCPSLTEPNVIVIRNIDHHNAVLIETPTLYSTKQEIIKWLDHYNITYHEHLTKYELYNLAEQYTDLETPLYKVDCILKARGHTLLRHPKYVEETNPATVLFNLMKWNWGQEELRKINTGQGEKVTKSCFNDLVMSASNFLESYTLKMVAEEKKMINLEKEIDDNLDHLLLSVTAPVVEDSDIPSGSDTE